LSSSLREVRVSLSHEIWGKFAHSPEASSSSVERKCK
jgi:hypothetical protein